MMTEAERLAVLMQEMVDGGMLCDPISTALIMGYNAGRAQESTFYAKVRGQELRPAYICELRCAVADTIMQLRVLLALHKEGFEEIVLLGEERLRERIEDIRSRGLERPVNAKAMDDILHAQVPLHPIEVDDEEGR